MRGRQFQGREGEIGLSEQGWDKSKAGFRTVFLIITVNTYIFAYVKLICLYVFLYKMHTHHSTCMCLVFFQCMWISAVSNPERGDYYYPHIMVGN